MTFLIGLLSDIFTKLIEYFIGKEVDREKEKAAQEAAQKEINDKNAAAPQQNEAAQTKEERDAAAKKLFDNFDGT